jgi:hypothetical protein
MANGDAAAAAGLAVFASTQDIRQGYDNDNIRGDELAQHLTAGTHPASAIVSGTLDTARIPNLDAAKITTGTFNTARIPNLNADKITAGTLTRPISTSSACTITGQLNVQSIQATNASYGINGATGSPYFAGPLYAVNTYNQTNSGRAVYVASNGLFGVGSSSKRYKKNITEAQLDVDKIRELKVKTFQYKAAFSTDETVHTGVIAEDLVELGLNEFVFFDDQGNADGVAYEKLALAVLALAQTQADKLDALETRLNAIEERLA